MKLFFSSIEYITRFIYIIAGTILSMLVLLTLCDVILRNFGHPIAGSMEIIQYGGCVIFSFSVPYGTLLGAQVIVDIITERLKPKNKKIIEIITRCIGIILFLFIAYYFYKFGIDMAHSGERTSSFRIPYYPFAFVLSFSFLMQSLTILYDLIKKVKE
ncbi:MAG TPA: TRAP transporter small permease [Syntrophorhabdaceae bacterium]|nr:TRAP transporter small permease [Syntrophorhabdaceae bacterium]HON86246.1 TRAP transporter small permease [Syntrophorhabdaceae bacterium]HOT42666.1 TRAP transporter small permease [Syntrophorhabdaceae bacterium]HQE80979.1 TRAP transporter small permease [Syntrophorhabdaceae bacterium]HQH44000.1 TRAP transporter small permease [Syntrophorhabdaceae bacterium]